MEAKEIKAVFDRTFNGMPNPIFFHPVRYFEHNGYLCEVANSASSAEVAREVSKNLYKTPLAMFEMMFGDCGAWLTVLTMDGEKTSLGGHFDTEEELNQLLEKL